MPHPAPLRLWHLPQFFSNYGRGIIESPDPAGDIPFEKGTEEPPFERRWPQAGGFLMGSVGRDNKNKKTGINPVLMNRISKRLLDVDFTAGSFNCGFDLLSFVFLSFSFEYCTRASINEVFSLFEAKACSFTYSFEYVDL